MVVEKKKECPYKSASIACVAVSTAVAAWEYADIWLGLNSLLLLYWQFYYVQKS